MVSYMVPAHGGTPAVIGGVLVAGRGRGFSSNLALTIVNCVGQLLSCILAAIPLFTFLKPIVQDKNVGDRTVYDHFLTMLGSAAWGLLAFIDWKVSRSSTIINGVCFLFRLACVLPFIRYAAGRARWIAVGLLLIALVASSGLAYTVVVKVIGSGEVDKRTIATIASVVSGITYSAVAKDIVEVWRSKDVANINSLLEVVLNFLNAVASVYFAYLSTPVDHYVGFPHAIGILFLVALLGAYVVHCKTKPMDEEMAQQTTETDDRREEETPQIVSKANETTAFEGETSQTVANETVRLEGETSQTEIVELAKEEEFITAEELAALKEEASKAVIKAEELAALKEEESKAKELAVLEEEASKAVTKTNEPATPQEKASQNVTKTDETATA